MEGDFLSTLPFLPLFAAGNRYLADVYDIFQRHNRLERTKTPTRVRRRSWSVRKRRFRARDYGKKGGGSPDLLPDRQNYMRSKFPAKTIAPKTRTYSTTPSSKQRMRPCPVCPTGRLPRHVTLEGVDLMPYVHILNSLPLHNRTCPLCQSYVSPLAVSQARLRDPHFLHLGPRHPGAPFLRARGEEVQIKITEVTDEGDEIEVTPKIRGKKRPLGPLQGRLKTLVGPPSPSSGGLLVTTQRRGRSRKDEEAEAAMGFSWKWRAPSKRSRRRSHRFKQRRRSGSCRQMLRHRSGQSGSPEGDHHPRTLQHRSSALNMTPSVSALSQQQASSTASTEPPSHVGTAAADLNVGLPQTLPPEEAGLLPAEARQTLTRLNVQSKKGRRVTVDSGNEAGPDQKKRDSLPRAHRQSVLSDGPDKTTATRRRSTTSYSSIAKRPSRAMTHDARDVETPNLGVEGTSAMEIRTKSEKTYEKHGRDSVAKRRGVSSSRGPSTARRAGRRSVTSQSTLNQMGITGSSFSSLGRKNKDEDTQSSRSKAEVTLSRPRTMRKLEVSGESLTSEHGKHGEGMSERLPGGRFSQSSLDTGSVGLPKRDSKVHVRVPAAGERDTRGFEDSPVISSRGQTMIPSTGGERKKEAIQESGKDLMRPQQTLLKGASTQREGAELEGLTTGLSMEREGKLKTNLDGDLAVKADIEGKREEEYHPGRDSHGREVPQGRPITDPDRTSSLGQIHRTDDHLKQTSMDSKPDLESRDLSNSQTEEAPGPSRQKRHSSHKSAKYVTRTRPSAVQNVSGLSEPPPGRGVGVDLQRGTSSREETEVPPQTSEPSVAAVAGAHVVRVDARERSSESLPTRVGVYHRGGTPSKEDTKGLPHAPEYGPAAVAGAYAVHDDARKRSAESLPTRVGVYHRGGTPSREDTKGLPHAPERGAAAVAGAYAVHDDARGPKSQETRVDHKRGMSSKEDTRGPPHAPERGAAAVAGAHAVHDDARRGPESQATRVGEDAQRGLASKEERKVPPQVLQKTAPAAAAAHVVYDDARRRDPQSSVASGPSRAGETVPPETVESQLESLDESKPSPGLAMAGTDIAQRKVTIEEPNAAAVGAKKASPPQGKTGKWSMIVFPKERRRSSPQRRESQPLQRMPGAVQGWSKAFGQASKAMAFQHIWREVHEDHMTWGASRRTRGRGRGLSVTPKNMTEREHLEERHLAEHPRSHVPQKSLHTGSETATVQHKQVGDKTAATSKEEERKAAQEGEIMAAKEGEMKAAKEGEMKAAKEGEMKAAKEGELKPAKEGEFEVFGRHASLRSPIHVFQKVVQRRQMIETAVKQFKKMLTLKAERAKKRRSPVEITIESDSLKGSKGGQVTTPMDALEKETPSSTGIPEDVMRSWLCGEEDINDVPVGWLEIRRNIDKELSSKYTEGETYAWEDEVAATQALMAWNRPLVPKTPQDLAKQHENWLCGSGYLLFSASQRRGLSVRERKRESTEDEWDDWCSKIPILAHRRQDWPKRKKLKKSMSVFERLGSKKPETPKVGRSHSLTHLPKSSPLYRILYRPIPKFVPKGLERRKKDRKKLPKSGKRRGPDMLRLGSLWQNLVMTRNVRTAVLRVPRYFNVEGSSPLKTESLYEIMHRDPDVRPSLPQKSKSCSALPDRATGATQLAQVFRGLLRTSVARKMQHKIRRMVVQERKHGPMLYRVMAERSNESFKTQMIKFLGIDTETDLEEEISWFFGDQSETQTLEPKDEYELWEEESSDYLEEDEQGVKVDEYYQKGEVAITLTWSEHDQMKTERRSKRESWKGEELIHLKDFHHKVRGAAPPRRRIEGLEYVSKEGRVTGKKRKGDARSVQQEGQVSTASLESLWLVKGSSSSESSCVDEASISTTKVEYSGAEAWFGKTSSLDWFSLAGGESFAEPAEEEELEQAKPARKELPVQPKKKKRRKVLLKEESAESCACSLESLESECPVSERQVSEDESSESVSESHSYLNLMKPKIPIFPGFFFKTMSRTESTVSMLGQRVHEVREARRQHELIHGKGPRKSRWLQKLEFPYYYMKGEQPPIDPEADDAPVAPVQRPLHSKSKRALVKKGSEDTGQTEGLVQQDSQASLAAQSALSLTESKADNKSETHIEKERIRKHAKSKTTLVKGTRAEKKPHTKPSAMSLSPSQHTAGRVDDISNSACLVDSAGCLASWNDNACHCPLGCLSNMGTCTTHAKAVRPLQDVLFMLNRKRRRTGRRQTRTLKRTPRTARGSTLQGQPSAQKRTTNKRGEAASCRRKQSFSVAAAGNPWPRAVLPSVYAVFPPVSKGVNVKVTRIVRRPSKGLQEQGLPQIVPKTQHQRRSTKLESKEGKVKCVDGKDRSRIKCPPLKPKRKAGEEKKSVAQSPSPISKWLIWKKKNQTDPLPFIVNRSTAKTPASPRKRCPPRQRTSTRLPIIRKL